MNRFKCAAVVFVGGFLLVGGIAFADVYPFEEEYASSTESKPAAASPSVQTQKVSEEPRFQVQQHIVGEAERAAAQKEIDQQKQASRNFLKYQTITFGNCGQVFLNLCAGIGGVYKDVVMKDFPDYGRDVASMPGGTVTLAGKFVDIEKQQLFEQNAKEKDVKAYVAEQQQPLTPEEQKLLNEIRNKPISSSSVTGK